MDAPPRWDGWRTFRTVILAIAAVLVLVTGAVPLDSRAIVSAAVQEEDVSPEQQLAERYAPIAYLKRQRTVCDPSGEPYRPLPVGAVLDDPSVLLRLDTGDHEASRDQIVKSGPSMSDLAWLGEGYYIDFPGNPLNPGCIYEQWSRRKAEVYQPTAYARIATEEGSEGLALQYWLFWVFNDFNNNHEGDWEMIQLTFAASTVEEALTQEPETVTYSQHGGGERADWDSGKLLRNGDHPVIFSAAGSHATYYEEHLFIGWGEGGAGFGCDDARRPSHRVALNVVLLPAEPRMDGDFAWLLYYGRWGEKQSWQFNGAIGPQRGRKWHNPLSWDEHARERSLSVSEAPGLGPMPDSVFCTVSDQASRVLMFFNLHPWRTATTLTALFGLAVYLFVSLRRSLVRAARVYLAWWGSFTAIGLVLIPLGFLVSSLQRVIRSNPPVEWVVELLGRSDSARLIVSLLVGSAQSVLEAVLIAPAIMAIVEMIRRGEPPDVRHAYRQALACVPNLAQAYVRVQVGLIVRFVSILGIPFFVRERVRWAFYGQAVMIDGARSARGPGGTSAAAVHGAWWRTAAEVLVFSVIGLLPGPVIGMVLMVTYAPSIEFVNALSSVIYAFTVPYKVIGLTLFYLDRTGRKLTSPRLAQRLTPRLTPARASVAARRRGARSVRAAASTQGG
jgi:hypothetical protein